MSQVQTFTWTNAASAVARNLNCGFDPVEVTVVDITNGGSFYWSSGFPDAYVLDVDSGAIVTTNGVTPLNQGAIFGAAITAFTVANPGVITASNIAQVGIVAGDTIRVAGVSDDGTGTSMNQDGTFTVASVTATAITLNQSTVGYSAYVSGGFVTRISDSAGTPIPIENVGIIGLRLGTSAVGANSASMCAVVRGDNSVV